MWLTLYFCLLLVSTCFLLFQWPSASAFVKPLPCVHRALVTHAVTLIYKWVGTRKKNKNQREHVFLLLFELENTRNEELIPPFVFLFSPCVPVCQDSDYSHTNLQLQHYFKICSCHLTPFVILRLPWTRRPLVPTVYSLCTYAGVSPVQPPCGDPSSTWWIWQDRTELARLV